MDTVRELSKPGQALSKDAPTATTNNPAWWVGGEPTLARDLLHERLIDEARAAAPDVEQQYRAIVLAGPPGAGKSTVLADVLGEHRGKYLVIDADEFKRSLLREAQQDGSYDTWLMPDAIREREAQGERFYPLELASLVHEESSYLAKSLRADAIAAGDNIVIDTVLSNEADALALGQRLAAAGYDVRVIDVEVPYELSEERIRGRWEHAEPFRPPDRAARIHRRGHGADHRPGPCRHLERHRPNRSDRGGGRGYGRVRPPRARSGHLVEGAFPAPDTPGPHRLRLRAGIRRTRQPCHRQRLDHR